MQTFQILFVLILFFRVREPSRRGPIRRTLHRTSMRRRMCSLRQQQRYAVKPCLIPLFLISRSQNRQHDEDSEDDSTGLPTRASRGKPNDHAAKEELDASNLIGADEASKLFKRAERRRALRSSLPRTSALTPPKDPVIVRYTNTHAHVHNLPPHPHHPFQSACVSSRPNLLP